MIQLSQAACERIKHDLSPIGRQVAFMFGKWKNLSDFYDWITDPQDYGIEDFCE